MAEYYSSSRVHLCTGPVGGSHPAPVLSSQWYSTHKVLDWCKDHSPVFSLAKYRPHWKAAGVCCVSIFPPRCCKPVAHCWEVFCTAGEVAKSHLEEQFSSPQVTPTEYPLYSSQGGKRHKRDSGQLRLVA